MQQQAVFIKIWAEYGFPASEAYILIVLTVRPPGIAEGKFPLWGER